MSELTDTQRETLAKMPGYQMVVQFETGAVLVMFDKDYSGARIIDSDGHVWTLGDYLHSIVNQGS